MVQGSRLTASVFSLFYYFYLSGAEFDVAPVIRVFGLLMTMILTLHIGYGQLLNL
jgi:hypothetical protein